MSWRFATVILGCLILAMPAARVATADTADELRAQIDDHSKQIDALNKEIAQYEAQLTQVGAKKKTLQNTISSLNLTIKKTTANISVTKNKIATTEAQIKQLAGQIADKQMSIEHQKAAIGQLLRGVSAADDRALVLQFLSEESLTDTWRDIDASDAVQRSISVHIDEISREKAQLSDAKTATETKRSELLAQKDTLLAQQGSLNAQKSAQNDLLSQTRSQEAEYQRILKEKRAQEASFESALSDLKAKLAVAVNPDQITPTGKGVLHWPVDTVRVTQYFGNTAFAASGAYKGKGHNGIDLAAPIGTPIKAALTGTVVGTGNTDVVRGCYSFGKWVLVKHANGLDTLYAHLSTIQVSAGESVATGQLLGYSGETGYATGPHLHFGVYVSSATQIMTLSEATNTRTPCANAKMPIAPLSAYLNPMSYL
jgi:murein DD-endopeptidase MepM/ murein hydrolase activator NlpD